MVARPLGITIICLLGFLNAISIILTGLGLAGIGGLAAITGTAIGGIIGGLGIAGGLAFLAVGIIAFVIVYGLWRMQKWAWSWTIFFQGILLVLYIINVNLLGILLSAIIIGYLWMNKRLFK